MTSFSQLPLSPGLQRALAQAGFSVPTPIQAAAIPVALDGKDVVGIAQTGTGKTLAFGIPLVERMAKHAGPSLIVAPTRELAAQIEETLRKIGGPLGMRTALLVGGAGMGKQVADLRKRPRFIVATPGRLVDHLQQGTARLNDVHAVVLDEADRMLDMGFLPAIRRILEATSKNRQTMLFTATWPESVSRVAGFAQRDPVRIEIERPGTTAELVEQGLHVVDQISKPDHLDDILRQEKGTVLVFTRTRHGARKVAKGIRNRGHQAAELHSDLTLAQRRASLEGFKKGTHRVLVATDIAARGIDVKEIALVVNYDLPDQPEDYVHRIGRTGRAGATGRALTFATPEQGKELAAVEREIDREIPMAAGSPLPRTESLDRFRRRPTTRPNGRPLSHPAPAAPRSGPPRRNRPARRPAAA